MSDKVVMNGPAEFEMKVHVINDETGQSGTVTVGLGHFKYPTRKDIEDRISRVPDDLNERGMTGFRLANKEEAFNAWSLENTGQTFAVPGGQDWDPLI